MKRSRAAALARRRALAMFMALSVIGSALAPAAPGWAGIARADAGSGTIVHSADGVLLRAEPSFGAEVLETVPEGTVVGLRPPAWEARRQRKRRLSSSRRPGKTWRTPSPLSPSPTG